MNALKALLKRALDGALRRLGLVRTRAAATQTVDAIYLSLLGRPAGAQELVDAVGVLASRSRPVAALVDTLVGSAESKAHLLRRALPEIQRASYLTPQAHFETLVEPMFLALLGRPPENEARAAYVEALRSGRLTVEAFVTELLSNPEAAGRIVNAGFLDPPRHLGQIVDAVFYALLGRTPEDQTRAAYTEALRTERLSMAGFVDEIAAGPEAQERRLKEVIDAVFRTALGRPADNAMLKAFVNDISLGVLTLDRAIEELSTGPEATARVLKRLEPVLKDRGYITASEHYGVVADALFRSVMGRPLDEGGREAFGGAFISGDLTLDGAINQLMNSEEVKMRILTMGLPDVLEGIYRALMGTPETNSDMRGLIRSAASQETFETIRTMSMTAEACHYMMRPIIEAHRQQLLAPAGRT